MSDPFVGQSILDATGGKFSLVGSNGLQSSIGNNNFNLIASGLSQPQATGSSIAPAPSLKHALAQAM